VGYSGIVIESISFSDSLLVRGWFRINDNQTGAWVQINNTQSTNWNSINNGQNPGWLPVNDDQ
jgi:hypothetical protein